jgi:hypothetical protein
MAENSIPLVQVGGLFAQMDAQFLVCLTASLGIVFLFCRQNFGFHISDPVPNDITTQLLPSHLATKNEYHKGFFIYFASMTFALLTLSLIGPKPLQAFGITIPPDIGNAAILIVVAGTLVGLVANVKSLQQIEKWVRKFGHDRALIAAAALATAERQAMAGFDFGNYKNLVPPLRGVAPSDFTAPRNSLEHSWARLNCLLHELNTRLNAGNTNGLDVAMLKKYRPELVSIGAERDALELDIIVWRNNPGMNGPALYRRVHEALFSLYVLLGCAVRLKKPRENETLEVLSTFGFEFPAIQVRPPSRDMMLVGLAVMAAGVFVVSMAALLIGHMGLWTVSDGFPRTSFHPINILASTVLAHSVAIFAADQFRTRRLNSNGWFRQNGTHQEAKPASYVGAALAAGLAGYAAFVVWGLMFQPATADLFRDAIPYALLPATTGGFFVVHLDNAELNTRPSRFAEIGLQALVTALCGLVAVTATNAGALTKALDMIVLITVISATIGAAFGAYFPVAAAAPRFDPLTALQEERVRALKEAALNKFGDKAAAKQWIEHPLPALGGDSPKVAARDIRRYGHAFDLLKAP